MYLVVVWGSSDIYSPATCSSLSSAVRVVGYFDQDPDLLGGAIYRTDSEGRPEELIRFFDFC